MPTIPPLPTPVIQPTDWHDIWTEPPEKEQVLLAVHTAHNQGGIETRVIEGCFIWKLPYVTGYWAQYIIASTSHIPLPKWLTVYAWKPLPAAPPFGADLQPLSPSHKARP